MFYSSLIIYPIILGNLWNKSWLPSEQFRRKKIWKIFIDIKVMKSWSLTKNKGGQFFSRNLAFFDGICSMMPKNVYRTISYFSITRLSFILSSWETYETKTEFLLSSLGKKTLKNIHRYESYEVLKFDEKKGGQFFSRTLAFFDIISAIIQKMCTTL